MWAAEFPPGLRVCSGGLLLVLITPVGFSCYIEIAALRSLAAVRDFPALLRTYVFGASSEFMHL